MYIWLRACSPFVGIYLKLGLYVFHLGFWCTADSSRNRKKAIEEKSDDYCGWHVDRKGRGKVNKSLFKEKWPNGGGGCSEIGCCLLEIVQSLLSIWVSWSPVSAYNSYSGFDYPQPYFAMGLAIKLLITYCFCKAKKTWVWKFGAHLEMGRVKLMSNLELVVSREPERNVILTASIVFSYIVTNFITL